MPMGGDIQDWFKSLPLFTRYWFGGTILFTLLGRFGLLQPAWLVLYLEPLIHRFQVIFRVHKKLKTRDAKKHWYFLVMAVISYYYFSDLEAIYGVILLPAKSTNWISLPNKPVLSLQLFSPTWNRNFRWTASRLLFHACICMDM